MSDKVINVGDEVFVLLPRSKTQRVMFFQKYGSAHRYRARINHSMHRHRGKTAHVIKKENRYLSYNVYRIDIDGGANLWDEFMLQKLTDVKGIEEVQL